MRRLVATGATGIIAGVAIAPVASWELTVVFAWSAACLAFLGLVWWGMVRWEGATTERLATVEDDSRFASGLLLLAASTASLVGVAFALHLAGNTDGAERVVL